MCVDFGFDGGEGGRGERDGDEDDLGVDAVFGLREEVGGDEGGVAGVVCDDLYVRNKKQKRVSIEKWK